jgi:hypothetical protein
VPGTTGVVGIAAGVAGGVIVGGVPKFDCEATPFERKMLLMPCMSAGSLGGVPE